MSAFKTYKDPANFMTWCDHTMATIHAQNFSRVLDPTYVPTSPDDAEDLRLQKCFLYAVLLANVHTPKGKAIVKAHKHDMDGPLVLEEIMEDALQSASGKMRQASTRTKLSTTSIEGHRGPQVEFLVDFQTSVQGYNDTQTNPALLLTGPVVKDLLQQAVQAAPNLKEVASRETTDMVTRGAPPHTYEEHMLCLMAAAELHDGVPPTRRSRSANVADVTQDTPGDDAAPRDPTNSDLETWVAAYAAQTSRDGNRPTGPYIPSEVFSNLSREAKKNWFGWADTDKQVITDNLKPISANVHMMETPHAEPDPDPEIPTETPVLQAHRAATQASTNTGEPTHPADPRRLLSEPKPTGKPPRVRQAKMAHFERVIDDYWDTGADDQWYDTNEPSDF